MIQLKCIRMDYMPICKKIRAECRWKDSRRRDEIWINETRTN